jgi:NAD(P)-dependent dehydrogenase (short-subunit alcohol dehydrogenase family)
MLKDRVAVITGASEGIGYATADVLGRAGARLILVARTESKLADVTTGFQNRGIRAVGLPADVTDSNQVTQMMHTAHNSMGRIDILVNNVGRGLRKSFIDTTDADWQTLVSENLTSVFYCCRAVLKLMHQQKSGQIVNIASRSGRVGEADLAAYSAVKHGVVGITRALSEEEGALNIRVNAVCPGPVATERMHALLPQVDKTNWLTPEDVAAAVLFLVTSPGKTMQGRTMDLF